MMKETEKHEGFATITWREKFFFLKEVFGNKQKESNNEEGGQRERGNIRRIHIKEWKHEKSQQIEKETRNISFRMRTIKMEI